MLGCSYGAATAIQLAAADHRVAAVVAVAPFTNLASAVDSYAHSIGLWWFVSQRSLTKGILDAEELGGFDPAKADSLVAIRRTTTPVLLIHGDQDKKLPLASSQALYRAAPIAVHPLLSRMPIMIP